MVSTVSNCSKNISDTITYTLSTNSLFKPNFGYLFWSFCRAQWCILKPLMGILTFAQLFRLFYYHFNNNMQSDLAVNNLRGSCSCPLFHVELEFGI